VCTCPAAGVSGGAAVTGIHHPYLMPDEALHHVLILGNTILVPRFQTRIDSVLCQARESINTAKGRYTTTYWTAGQLATSVQFVPTPGQEEIWLQTLLEVTAPGQAATAVQLVPTPGQEEIWLQTLLAVTAPGQAAVWVQRLVEVTSPAQAATAVQFVPTPGQDEIWLQTVAGVVNPGQAATAVQLVPTPGQEEIWPQTLLAVVAPGQAAVSVHRLAELTSPGQAATAVQSVLPPRPGQAVTWSQMSHAATLGQTSSVAAALAASAVCCAASAVLAAAVAACWAAAASVLACCALVMAPLQFKMTFVHEVSVPKACSLDASSAVDPTEEGAHTARVWRGTNAC
jgi:hypothetical protein